MHIKGGPECIDDVAACLTNLSRMKSLMKAVVDVIEEYGNM